MYEIIEVANGWIVIPNSYGEHFSRLNHSEFYVFNDIDLLNKHLKQTLKVLSDKSNC